ncbi:hypothetical protein ACFW3Z_25410 [Nocardiopsis alba]|uniref:hypothetical protein n=1 Tax=Nocardiopsis alba TaxID=53437 RepID=UPI0033B212FB
MDELDRVRFGPTGEDPSVMVRMDVNPLSNAGEYACRLRRVLTSVIATGSLQGFEREHFDHSSLPGWFLASFCDTEPVEGSADDLVLQGCENYYRHRQGDIWGVHEWISLFAPEDRRWSWWDVVGSDGGCVSVFVDTRGEPVVPFEELWWMLYTTGARSVSGPVLATSDDWEAGKRLR